MNQLAALGLTLLIEAPIVFVASKKITRPLPWRIAAGIIPSCITHPFAWHAIGNFSAADYNTGFIVIELLVVVAETPMLVLLTGMKWSSAVLVSIVANSASCLFGVLLFALAVIF